MLPPGAERTGTKQTQIKIRWTAATARRDPALMGQPKANAQAAMPGSRNSTSIGEQEEAHICRGLRSAAGFGLGDCVPKRSDAFLGEQRHEL
jgi:hypothetical protein